MVKNKASNEIIEFALATAITLVSDDRDSKRNVVIVFWRFFNFGYWFNS